MEPSPGQLLVATPQLLDTNFLRTVILVLEHNDVGSLGVVLNRPTELAVTEALPGWEVAVMAPAVLFAGGPVERGGILGIGTNDSGEVVPADLELGPDDVGPIRLFEGYAGWSPGQLAVEIAEESWWVLDVDDGDVFGDDPRELWYQVLGRQSDSRSMLRHFPDDPSLN
jgi:putative transcriptional regulator